MRIFLTGASGFVGGRAARRLVSQGHTVLAMARSDASAQRVASTGAQVVRSSLATVTAADLRGVEVVVHAAAYVEEYGPEAVFDEVNVEGTRRLLEASRQAGVERFVHISSVASIWDGGDLVDVDEDTPFPAAFRFPYARTKAASERLVRGAEGLHTVVLRPCFVWGEGDTTVLPVLRRMVAEGSWVWLDQGRAVNSTSHVDNVVHAIELALTRGQDGAAYFITDDRDRSLREFFTELAATEGLELPERSVPGWLVRGAAHALEAAWLAVDRPTPPPVTVLAAYASSRTITVRSDRARRELGYAPQVAVTEGVRRLAS